MLPVYRSLPSEAGLSSCLSKRPSFVLNKLLLRWLALACVVIAFLWFGDLLSLGQFEPLLRPLDLPNTTTTTTNQFQRPPNVPPPPTKEEQDVWEPRKNEVRNAFKHAWSGYKNIAYPNDELRSLSGGQSNKSFFPSLTFHSIDFSF
jgi:mannosyl-oligosaccharide alpha-1,2-mannosidase